jgi:hypothetical protein
MTNISGKSSTDPTALSDAEITTTKKVSRRSLLASTGIAFAAGAAAAAAGMSVARAGDKKEGDMRDRQRPDPQRQDAD